MLRGNNTARVDAKGRLKVPSSYRRVFDERWGTHVYVTSLTGEAARIYPLKEWEIIEERLSMLPSMDPAKRKQLIEEVDAGDWDIEVRFPGGQFPPFTAREPLTPPVFAGVPVP